MRSVAERHLRNRWDSVKLTSTRRHITGHELFLISLLRVITETAGDEQDRHGAG